MIHLHGPSVLHVPCPPHTTTRLPWTTFPWHLVCPIVCSSLRDKQLQHEPAKESGQSKRCLASNHTLYLHFAQPEQISLAHHLHNLGRELLLVIQIVSEQLVKVTQQHLLFFRNQLEEAVFDAWQHRDDHIQCLVRQRYRPSCQTPPHQTACRFRKIPICVTVMLLSPADWTAAPPRITWQTRELNNYQKT